MKHCKRCGNVLMGNEQLSETCNRCLDLGYASMSDEEYERLDIYAYEAAYDRASGHMAQSITIKKIGRYIYVSVDGDTVAIMERSPWTGEYCYGLRHDFKGEYGETVFRPPFKPTRFRTAKAAAKVAVTAAL